MVVEDKYLVVEDRYLALSLKERPDFLIRLEEFASFYSLKERPALVLQARPAPECNVDCSLVDDREAVERFLGGTQSRQEWWQGFRARVGETPVFRGVASLPMHGQTAWASEVHRDGYFIAGIWRFPDVGSERGQQVPAVPDLFEGIFRDFLAVVSQTLAGLAAPKVVFEATATLLNATKLHFAAVDDFTSRLRITRRPAARRYVQWPVEAIRFGDSQWEATAAKFGSALKCAFVPIEGAE